MSAQLFDSQLLVPDDTKSHQQIAALITAGNYTGPGLSDVAHKYLDAFCNPSFSDSRRRWAGIALLGMMRASATVVQRLKKLTRGPSRVGNIILDRKESEEHKIVAGLVIRQGLEAGIDFADFWTSDKVPHSAPKFPREAGEPWMGQFQAYLDDLSSLKLTDSANDPVILYPMSISTEDNFQWTGTSAVAAIERGLLTIVVPDSTLTKFRFLELSISHIKEVHLRQESPYESQEGQSEYSMYTSVITLRSKSSGYRLDSSDCKGSRIRVSFRDREDAVEFEAGLQDTSKSTTKSKAGEPKTARSTRTGSSVQTPRRSSAGLVDPVVANGGQGAHQRSNVDLKRTHGQVVSSEHLDQEPQSSLQATDEKINGKLPRVSKATIQKVARTQHLQSGPSKSSKARTAKKAIPIVISNGDEESGESSQDEYDLKSATTMHTSASIEASRTAPNRRRVYEEDEDFVPDGSKAKTKPTKRKRGSSDAAEQIQPMKKKTQKLDNTTDHPTHNPMAKIQDPTTGIQEQMNTPQARKPNKQSVAQQITQNGKSARPSLIGALIKSKSPTGGDTPLFKRPGQPASTPGRPRAHIAQTTPKTRTPVEICKDLDDLPTPYQTSTPRSRSMHEEDFGLGHTPADTEILSSNTKKVPDSPHAESTAISGHADQDDVHREKHRADLETAKSDPFQRQKGTKTQTTFLRKLTGEGSVEGGANHTEPPTMPAEASQDDHEADELPTDFASQQLPKDSPTLFKHRAQTNRQARTFEHAQALSFESTRAMHISRNKPTRTGRSLNPSERSSPARCATAKMTCQMDVNAEEGQVRSNDSVDPGPPEAVEDTLLDVPGRAIGSEDETTLISKAIDMPEQYGGNAADLRFRSSPPVPDSSSIRDAYSDASEREPDPSPPTSRADEMEWESAFQPHQRDLHEQLLRTSKRVVRHIVDNGTAVTDIAGVFAKDGERLLGLHLERQRGESAEAFQELESKRQDLLKELTRTSKHFKQQRQEVKADK
ncbi:hypothetical protein B5807_01539 [Epicoccum nigrum]|uniref:Uncharacterized protein n=1 Tax=Epicoccum nigrum TaxID=105696 RepID=A0A1Y2MDJ5_EPING|nr:hypothetical protein B5807_01539 [Epicoccum nigrum]